MDPVASIRRLSTSIAYLSVKVEKFAHQVRDAKQDMRDLSEQLASLEDILEGDFESPSEQSLDLKKKRLIRIVDDCDRVTKEMAKLLTSLSSGRGETPWLGFPKTKMAELQDSLEEGQLALGGMIEMKKTRDAEERHNRRAANAGQDSESMLSVHQSLLETAPVPYAIEDPYPKSTRPQRRSVNSIQVSAATSISRSGILSSSPEDMRSSEKYQSTPFSNLPVEARSKDQSNTGSDIQILKVNGHIRQSINTSRGKAPVSHNVQPNQDPRTIHPEDTFFSEDAKSPGLIVVPIEHTGEYKEVLSSNASVKSVQNLGRPSESSAPSSTSPSLLAGKIDQIAFEMAARARNRLSLSEQKKIDKELLKRIKEGAEMSKIVSLLDRGADPNASGPRNTALTTEIQYSGRQQVIELLLSRGAEPNATSDGIPEHKRVEDGYVGRLKTGLGATRSIDAVAHQIDILFLAALHTDIEIIKLLVSYGARLKPYPSSIFGQRSMSSSTGILERKNSAGSEPSSHRSAVLAAAESKKWDIVQFLIIHGADPNDVGVKSGSTLQLATASNKKDLMELLIEHGADVNAQGGQYGAPLIAAAVECHPTAAKILLDAGANVNIQSRSIGTALQAAVLNGYLNVVKLLLERGADTMIGFVLDTALQRLKDDPEDSNRKAIVRLLEGKGARSGPVEKKVPEWAGLFSESY